MKRFEERSFLLHEIDYVVLRNHFSVHSDSFSEVNEMWRSVESDFVAVELQDGSERVGATSFSVGSGDVDGSEFFVRMPEVFVQRECGLQSWFIGFSADLLEEWCSVEEIVNGFRVGHLGACFLSHIFQKKEFARHSHFESV